MSANADEAKNLNKTSSNSPRNPSYVRLLPQEQKAEKKSVQCLPAGKETQIRTEKKRTAAGTTAHSLQSSRESSVTAKQQKDSGSVQVGEAAKKPKEGIILKQDINQVKSREPEKKLQEREKDITGSRCSFLVSRQSMPIHMLHPHAHRRHYPHHLLDHFSGNLTQPTTSPATWEEFIPTAESGTQGTRGVAVSGIQEENTTTASGGNINRIIDNAVGRETRDPNNNPASLVNVPQLSAEETYAHLQQEPHAWPFYGSEPQVLPSGRRVSFLRQACLGFSRTDKKEQDRNESMDTICPKAFREASFSTVPRRTFLRNNGVKVAELRRRFNDMAKDDSATNFMNLNKFRNETISGPQTDTGMTQQSRTTPRIVTGPTILDTSSTKGKHPIPKAPGLRSPSCPPGGQNIGSIIQKTKSRVANILASPTQQKSLNEKIKSPIKTTSNSPTRKKTAATTKPVGHEIKDGETKSFIRTAKGAKIATTRPARTQSPQKKVGKEVVSPKTSKPLSVAPQANKKDSKSRKIGNQMTKTGGSDVAISKKPPAIQSSPKDETSSESFCEGSSLVMVSADDDVTSTYEELSSDINDLSDRNFLIDYGDPSRFYFRNEWGARMNEIDENTKIIKELLMSSGLNSEALEGTMMILEEVEAVKQEMGELYDYFDHFEREEDTLLQQVQRQLVHANRYCKILQYRLDRAEHHQAEHKRVQELEEELKLSRQVAVSLHWELQAADTKQARLEKENTTLRQELMGAETSRQALNAQVHSLQNNIDQMSLHAPSQAMHVSKGENTCENSGDSASEMKRQLHFLEEKEQIMISRLVDLQQEKDSLKDELHQYREQYGELSRLPPSGAGRHTDLKLRLKLAEDQAGLLARKVIELQLENDNMIKLAAEKELMDREVIHRNPSVSDLQFLEDERESLRLALDEMEIENQTLAAELLRYKQAVHRQLHSSSSLTDSPLDVGLMIRIPRSNENSVFDDESKMSSRSHKGEDRNSIHHDSNSEQSNGDRNKIRPLSLHSPLNQTQKRTKMSISRTLSDIQIPLSPDSKSASVQITPVATTISTCTTPGTTRSVVASNGNRKSSSQKSKRKKVKTIDVGVGTDVQMEKPKSLDIGTQKSIAEYITEMKHDTRSQATSPIITNLQNLFGPAIEFASQLRQIKIATKSQATSPVDRAVPGTSRINLLQSSDYKPSHNVLLDEMRKQIACVRNIAESMDNVVDVEEMEAELERKGKEIVNAEYRRMKDRSAQKKQLSKMAKNLHKHIKDMEQSVSVVEGDQTPPEGSLSEVNGWNLHGNAELIPNQEITASETSTVTVPSSNAEDPASSKSSWSISSKFRISTMSDMSARVLEGIVLLIISYVLLTALPASALFQIFFLLFVFFIC